MRIHFIAIGGSIMHSLAIALKRAGHQVSGSDDAIHEPSRTRLEDNGLLPAEMGWFAERITPDIEAVILGMHAFSDNPELKAAQDLGLKMYSFPEFIYEHSRNKQRIVIAGSYGKTTITSMVMHVLRGLGREFDYLVGAQVPGFDNPVRLSEDAPIIIMEGDEYFASKMDMRPKFLVYQPHIALISGISWDHINVFPTEVEYKRQFGMLIAEMPKAGYLIYNEGDKELKEMMIPMKEVESLYLHTYSVPTYRIKDEKYTITLGNTTIGGLTSIGGEKMQVEVIGKHNMLNIAAAWKVCEQIGVELKPFLTQIATFKGAKSRLETVVNEPKRIVFKDFAHAPIKVSATVEAIAEMYATKRNLIACLELHTFSSLNKQFIKQYNNTLKAAKCKIVFINKHTLEAKRMPPISKEEVLAAFGDKNIVYVAETADLITALKKARIGNDVYLMMSSGDFGGLNLSEVGL